MLVKQDVFIWVCPKCGNDGGYCYDQAKMTNEELQFEMDAANSPCCTECREQMTVEVA